VSTPQLVGRDGVLEEVRALVAEGGLVTLAGVAGIGKSTLARAVLAAHEGEAHLITLEGEDDTADLEVGRPSRPWGSHLTKVVAARFARTLGLPRGSVSEIGRALAHREGILVVLDDADRAILGLAELLPRLMEAAPRAAFLVASRERLRLRVERVVAVPPLTPSDARRLLELRLPRGTRPDDETLGALTEWLEGIPLAIELAAARASMLAPGTGRRVDLLRGGFRDGERRHATLRDALEWSWSLLDEDHRCALAEATVFRGTFSPDDAAVVLSVGTDSTRLDLLQSLVDKSLLRSVGTGVRLFDAVREFASEHLESADRAAALARLDAHLAEDDRGDPADVRAAAARVVSGDSTLEPKAALAVVQRAAKLLVREGPAESLVELAGAAHVMLRKVEGATELRLFTARGLRMMGHLHDAAREAEAALEVAVDAALRAELLTEMALALHAQRDLDRADDLYRRALAAGPASRTLEGRVHANLGAVAHDRGDLETAESSYRSALVSLRVTGDARLIGTVRSNLALVAQERGELAEATTTFERGLEELEAAGERYMGAVHRSNLGALWLERGDATQAKELHDLALTHLRRIGDERSTVLCLCRRAAALALLGDVEDAEVDLEEARSLAHDASDPLLSEVVAIHAAFPALGHALLREGNARARALERCREILREEHAALSDDARAARRVLQSRMGSLEDLPATEAPEDALAVTIEARFFRAPGGEWEDLRKYRSQRTMLQRLVDEHDRSTGALDMEALQAALWPGERIRKDAASNRIHVTLSKLRGRGLKPWIQRIDGGYRLDPELTIARLPTTDPPA